MTRKSAAAALILLACAVAGSFTLVRVQLPAFRLPKNNTFKSYMGVQTCPPTSNNPRCSTSTLPKSTPESNPPDSNPPNPNSPEEPVPNLHATQTAERKELVETLQAANATNTQEVIPRAETPVEYVQTPIFTIPVTAEQPGESPTAVATDATGSASSGPFVLLAVIITIAIFLAAHLFRRFEG